MAKNIHEIRDPIHVFVRLSTDERKVLDSRPFQRLRHIHQLALTYLVYPGATHRRFEHSLGVMELAGRVYDIVTRNPIEQVRNEFSEELADRKHLYWRCVVRMAALCHDIDTFPFLMRQRRNYCHQDGLMKRLPPLLFGRKRCATYAKE